MGLSSKVIDILEKWYGIGECFTSAVIADGFIALLQEDTRPAVNSISSVLNKLMRKGFLEIASVEYKRKKGLPLNKLMWIKTKKYDPSQAKKIYRSHIVSTSGEICKSVRQLEIRKDAEIKRLNGKISELTEEINNLVLRNSDLQEANTILHERLNKR